MLAPPPKMPLIHGHYWILPLCAVFFWIAMLLGLLLWWAVAQHAERYEEGQATIIYVSNIANVEFFAGAEHQWLFIVGTVLTSLFYTLTLLAERWLRHLRRIPGAIRKRDRNADIVACVFGILGAISLIILACFNDLAFPNVHWSFTAIFVVCIAISALFQTLELWWLKQDHVERKHLKRAAILKWLIVGTAICCAIAFAATYGACAGQPDDRPLSSRCNAVKSTAAVLEWVIAFLYGAYLCTFGLDLWPAHKTIGHKFEQRLIAEDRANTLHAHKDPTRPGAPGGIGILGDVEAGTARPSLASDGTYGAQAGSFGLHEPEMAHTNPNAHGPISRTVY
ncbi:hypothetical protein JCM5296_002705 [Sporobolomyces johnsonii]